MKDTTPTPPLKANNNIITSVHNYQYLSICIDDQLRFETLTASKKERVTTYLRAMRCIIRVQGVANLNVLRIFNTYPIRTIFD